MDTMSPAERSQIMAKVKSKNTKPEMIVRKIAYAMGYRYRLHGKGIPGKPDLVFGWRRKVIFVHGCFWHGHDCGRCRLPKTRTSYWLEKINKNMQRDSRNQKGITAMGWQYIIIWECQLKEKEKVALAIQIFLDEANTTSHLNFKPL